MMGSVVGVRSNRTGAKVGVNVAVGGAGSWVAGKLSVKLMGLIGWASPATSGAVMGGLLGKTGVTTSAFTVIVTWVAASPPRLRATKV